MANKKGSHQLTRTDRIKLEALIKAGLSKSKIAEQLGVHRSTIYNELKRGQYMHRNSDYTEELRYSPDIAQEKAEANLKVRGTQLKIGNVLRDNEINSENTDDAGEVIALEIKNGGIDIKEFTQCLIEQEIISLTDEEKSAFNNNTYTVYNIIKDKVYDKKSS